MSNATKGVTRQEGKVTDDQLRLPNPTVGSATTHYQGVFMGTNSGGYAQPIDDTAPMWFMGYLNTGADVQLTTNDAASKYQIPISKPELIRSLTAAAVSAADFGKPAFISDNQTVAVTPGTYGNLAGAILKVPDTGSVFFRPVKNPRGSIADGQMRGIRTMAATGAETLTVLDLNKYILVPNTAAKAITLPADAVCAYGDLLYFIKTGGGNFTITITAAAANINGASTYTGVANNYKSACLMYLGATIGWVVVGGIPG